MKIYKQSLYNTDYKNLIDSLKNTYGYSLNEDAINVLEDSTITYKFGQEHPKADELNSLVIFRFTGDSISTADFLNKAGQENEFANKELNKQSLNQGIGRPKQSSLLSAPEE